MGKNLCVYHAVVVVEVDKEARSGSCSLMCFISMFEKLLVWSRFCRSVMPLLNLA